MPVDTSDFDLPIGTQAPRCGVFLCCVMGFICCQARRLSVCKPKLENLNVFTANGLRRVRAEREEGP